MRNYFAIAFSCVYLTLTVGVAKTTHYCMGREKHSSLFSFTTKKCPCFVLMKQQSCCQDEQKLVKIEDDHSGGQILSAPVPLFSFIGALYELQDLRENPEALAPVAESNRPPPKLALYKSFCSLVLYDSKV